MRYSRLGAMAKNSSRAGRIKTFVNILEMAVKKQDAFKTLYGKPDN